ncbi:peptidase inhibitor family I36 protein [Actinophytocola sp.]|uniref:peptidase inhibitor family I36 protein n=1 Tax=Actinophytocola sp. TaxID=1872138 RepID=UPI002D4A42A9|nr:peptidase inhibitor family I36 protein [Actinophytocola sp.]HYQ65365.1 peptidase inhibitor family I36 protein [Actinophytocola sp.]
MKILRTRRLAIFAIAILTVAGVAVNAAPASADSGSGHYPCLSNDLCYWYNNDFDGAAEGVPGSVPDLANPATFFEGAPGADGVGTRVWNNAASAANFDSDCRYNIYFDENFGGSFVTLLPFPQNGYALGSLGPLTNENRSQLYCV